jgi:diaminopimelate decarboxylase
MSKHQARIEYDLSKIQDRMQWTASLAEKSNIRLLFPVKSFPAQPVLKLAARYLHGFDVSNNVEYKLIQKFSTSSKDVWVSGPAHEVPKHKFKNRLHISLNSNGALKKFKQKEIAALRINASSLLSSKETSRFGVSFAEAEKTSTSSFALHLGQQTTRVDELMAMFSKFSELSQKRKITSVNFGGGWEHLSEADVEWMFIEIAKQSPNFQVFFEPGRWWSQDSGFIESEILDIREDESGWDVSVNASALGHLRWSRELRVARFPKEISLSGSKQIRIFGPTCAETDLIVTVKGEISDAIKSIGKTIRLDGVCGYSYAWNTGFNGFPAAAVKFNRGS